MGKEATRLAIHASLHSTLLRHSLKDSLRIGVCCTKPDLFITMLISICRSETHVVKLLVSRRATNCLERGRVVHVDAVFHEALLGVVHINILAERALIESVNVASVEMLRGVKHICATCF